MADQQFTQALDRSNELDLTVVGRRSGRDSTRPVWFVRGDGMVYLIPVSGTHSNWYKNVLKTPAVRLSVAGSDAAASAKPITDDAHVAPIRDAFRAKYGDANFERLYPHPDAAVEVSLQ
jgi:deazaflavin-dependent oxidoreductase (nitroreductase family)